MKVLIYGTGIMGKGIAQVFARKGHQVYLFNPREGSSDKAYNQLVLTLVKLVEREKISSSEKTSILNNITVISSLKEAYDVELVIEAITEDIELKKVKFKEIDKSINENAILCTNSSSLSITEIASVTSRPEKVIGLHFFNPAPVMKLIEIIKGVYTSDDTVEFARELSISLDKEPTLVQEAPGFIVNRILIPMINEAIGAFSDGIATIEDIDSAMVHGANHPIGPLALADLIGLDVCLNIMETLYIEFGSDKYSPHPLLRKMVRANKLGRKNKVGFYRYWMEVEIWIFYF